MKKVDLSIVIINYNTFELTCKCIDTILASKTTYSYEIVLVDNASKDVPPIKFKEKYPDLVLIESAVNEGFGRANNLGMEAAQGDYFLLLNSDTEVKEDTLQRSLTILQEEKADLYSCAQILADGTPFFCRYNTFQGQPLRKIWYSLPIFHLARFQIDNPVVKDISTVKTVSGAFMLLKRAVYTTTKGFDPDFFLYSEETEWCYNRIRKQYKMIYDPHNVFIHKQGASGNHHMSLQEFVSVGLSYYKQGYSRYLIYLLLQYGLAAPANMLFALISKKTYKKAYKDQVRLLAKALPYLFYRIPRFSNKFGARKEFLMIDELKK